MLKKTVISGLIAIVISLFALNAIASASGYRQPIITASNVNEIAELKSFTHNNLVNVTWEDTQALLISGSQEMYGLDIADVDNPQQIDLDYANVENILPTSPNGIYQAHIIDNSIEITAEDDYPVAELNAHQAPINQVDFSPDSQLIITASNDGTAIVWHIATGAQKYVFNAEDSVMLSAQFSPDGNHVLTASADGNITLWQLKSGKQVAAYQLDSSSATVVSFSQDGTLVVAGDAHGNLHMIDSASLTAINIMDAHDDAITQIEFSPEGIYLMTAGTDNMVRLWGIAR